MQAIPALGDDCSVEDVERALELAAKRSDRPEVAVNRVLIRTLTRQHAAVRKRLDRLVWALLSGLGLMAWELLRGAGLL